MSKTIVVDMNGKRIETQPGASILDLLAKHPHPSPEPALGALVNNRLMGLYRRLRSDSRVTTIGYSSKEGANLYRRTLSLILNEAAAVAAPRVSLEIGQALGGGYYYDVHVPEGEGEFGEEMLRRISDEMRRIVEEDRPIKPHLISSEEAEAYFLEHGHPEKAALVRQRNQVDISWLDMGHFADAAFGPIAPRTGLCSSFELFFRPPGFVLVFPNRRGKVPRILSHQKKLFDTYRETRRWNEMVGVWNVSQLNQACIDGSISEIIKVSEGLQEKKIARMADEIAGRREVRLVLIAGPSSSGKTTTTKRLAVQLRVNGIRPVMLSIDDYYVNRVDSPKNPDGSYNFECLEALDVPLFNAHLAELMQGRTVPAPVYNFVAGERRKDKTKAVSLASDQVLIIEGIHALNPRLTEAVESSHKFKLYVSALTQLAIDNHNRIFTSDVRLCRRIVRDRLFRGYSAAQTIRQWPSVREGEQQYIFPFQEEADVMFDTSLVYEPGVLKAYLRRFLMEVSPETPEYVEAYRLLLFLGLFTPIFPHEVPPNSILREFIGGSAFDY